MENTEFEELILKYISELPKKYKDDIINDNVAILVDYDNYTHLDNPKKNSSDVTLGLFQGVPKTAEPGHYNGLPRIITFFKKSFELVCSNDEEISVKLKKVLIHEIAHYYGIMDEDKLKALGYGF